MKTALIVAFATIMLAGCFRTRVVTNKPPSGVHHLQWSHTFIGGLIGAQIPAACEPAVVEARVGPLGLLASIITIGLWVPITVDVECAAGSALE